MMFSCTLQAQGTPKSFKNPIFNDTLWLTDDRYSGDVRITPTYINDIDSSDDDEICRYIVEDDKAVLLECGYYKDTKYYQQDFSRKSYKLFIAKNKYYFDSCKLPYWCYQTYCMVYWCSFFIENGYLSTWSPGSTSLNSLVDNCQNEFNLLEQHPLYKQSTVGYALDCVQALKSRGWDKYIPAKIKKHNEEYY